MMISIWDRHIKKWVYESNVDMVSLHNKDYIELDFSDKKSKKYDTTRYHLQFLHDSQRSYD